MEYKRFLYHMSQFRNQISCPVIQAYLTDLEIKIAFREAKKGKMEGSALRLLVASMCGVIYHLETDDSYNARLQRRDFPVLEALDDLTLEHLVRIRENFLVLIAQLRETVRKGMSDPLFAVTTAPEASLNRFIAETLVWADNLGTDIVTIEDLYILDQVDEFYEQLILFEDFSISSTSRFSGVLRTYYPGKEEWFIPIYTPAEKSAQKKLKN